MNDDTPMVINRNPAQTVSSVVKLFGFRVRGNSVYVFFAGLFGGVLSAIAAYQVSIVLAGVMMILPPVLSVFFIRAFIVKKPRGFIRFWVEEHLRGARLAKPLKSKGGRK